MDLDIQLAYQFIQAMLLILADILIKFIMKATAKSRTDFWFIYWFIPRHVKRPDCKQSKYYDRFPAKNWCTYEFQPTLDDPFLIELAYNINKKISRRSDKYKAGYILQLVQQGFTYQYDKDTYGATDKHQFPVCTSLLHIGDCEDGAYLGAGLSKLCGLDQATILVTGHQAYGVRVNGFGCKFSHEGKKYLWCESTSILPIGMHTNDQKIYGTYTPQIPPEEYLEQGTTYDTFDKYLLK